jgi:hypothetical protein
MRSVVVDDDGRLPQITTDSYRLPDVLQSFESSVGTPVFLRLGAHVELGDERYLRLYEFDVTDEGAARVPLAEARAEELAAPELHEAVAHWLDEQRGAPVPELRPPWSRPGWHARAESWVGRPLRPYRLWPLSAVLESDGEFFKAVFRGFHHEPAVTQALARENPGDVPDVVRIDEPQGWLLMRELRGRPAYEHEESAAGLATLERIHHAWRERHDALLALGAPDRRLAVLERTLPTFAPPEHAAALQAACRELAARGEPETLVHGDFHTGNVIVGDDGHAVIFDWSDACIAHPACDRHLYAPDDSDPVSAIVACLHQVVSYRLILANLEPSDQWWFAGEPDRWLDGALRRV